MDTNKFYFDLMQIVIKKSTENISNLTDNVPSFYCRGAWDEEQMTLGHRTLCRMLQKAVAKQEPEEYEPWQKALMSAVGQKCDWTDKKYLQPLLKYLEELN